MTIDTDRDPLEGLLDASAPSVPEPSEELRAEGLAMLVAAEHGTHRGVRRLPRIAVAGIVAGTLLTGGGLAAAAATYQNWDWVWWAQDSNTAFTYTLPSGAVCEELLGNVTSSNEELNQAIREYVSEVNLLALADVDAQIRIIREHHTSATLDDGTEVPVGHGTDYYSADWEYHRAVSMAVTELIEAELERQGFDLTDPALNLSYEKAGSCPGAEEHPRFPGAEE